ncbi:hypothetical protein [Sorangium sp. So ce887]|uniref:hypothetical protein n=1 Tax=Sorangium sp. So ce887 TaxID=3133324 RepID=UPI003F644B17
MEPLLLDLDSRSRRDSGEDNRPTPDIELAPLRLIDVALDDRDEDEDPERTRILEELDREPALRAGRSRATAADAIQEHLFEQLAELSDGIRVTYPPAKFFYLGLGRSPTPIIAYLQEVARAHPDLGISAANLPLGGIKGVGTGGMTMPTFTKSQKRNLFAFFDRYLDTGMYGAKTVLLIDFVESGSGLKVCTDVLRHFAGNPTTFSFFTGKMDINVQPLAIYPFTKYKGDATAARRFATAYAALGFATIDIPGDFWDRCSLASFLPGEVYKPLAEYYDPQKRDGKFTLAQAAEGGLPTRSPRYDALRRRIRVQLGG